MPVAEAVITFICEEDAGAWGHIGNKVSIVFPLHYTLRQVIDIAPSGYAVKQVTLTLDNEPVLIGKI